MNTSLSSWFVIVLALFAATLPFMNNRIFAVISLKFITKKSIWLRLIELIALYFVVGSVGFLLEAKEGSVFEQKWEFYAVTFFSFIVMAFPAFVYRYLLQKSRHRE